MYNLTSTVLQEGGYTAVQLQNAVKAIRSDHGFTDFQAFVNAEGTYGICSLFMLAHAAVESAWGTSYYAKARNNLFGFNSIDSNPNDASSYPSQGDAVDYYAHFLKEVYLTASNGQSYLGIPVGRDYHGTTIHDIFEDYSSSHDAEGNTVAGIMDLLLSHIVGNPQPPAPKAPTTPPETTYAIQGGDTFWGLEIKWNLPHGTLQSLNQGLNANDLQIGQEINIPTANGSHPSATTTYTIQPGNTFWGIETAHNLPHGVLQGLNPTLNPNDLQIGQQINVPAGV